MTANLLMQQISCYVKHIFQKCVYEISTSITNCTNLTRSYTKKSITSINITNLFNPFNFYRKLISNICHVYALRTKNRENSRGQSERIFRSRY